MRNVYYVYVWYRKDTGEPFYVGKGKENRFSQLINRTNHFMNVYRKHGGYSEKIIEGLTNEQAIKKEIELIKEYRSKYSIVNITNGGEGVSGLRHSPKTRKKLSDLSKKQWTNSETRKIVGDAIRKTFNDPERNRKIAEAHRGLKFSEERKKNHKVALNRPETKRKMAAAKLKYANIKCTSESCPEFEMIFSNIRDAADWLHAQGLEKANKSGIYRCIYQKTKTAYGYKWSLA